MQTAPPTPRTQRIWQAAQIHNWEKFPVMTWRWEPWTDKEFTWMDENMAKYNPRKKWLALTPGSLAANLYWVLCVRLSHNVAEGKADTKAE